MSRCFTPSNGTKGMWSISTRKCFPIRMFANFSHAHVAARASSICAYLHSVSYIDRDAYDTGLHEPSVRWRSTAPSPCDDASVETLVGAAGS